MMIRNGEGDQMKRREARLVSFALGAASLSLTGLARAQPATKVWQIGFLAPGFSPPHVEVFAQEMRRLGFIERQNLTTRFQEHGGPIDLSQSMALDLVRLNVDVLHAIYSPAAVMAAKQVAGPIPVVFSAITDPVGLALVKSLARLGDNMTGTSFDVTLAYYGKLVEMLKEVSPKVSRLVLLGDEPKASRSRCPYQQPQGWLSTTVPASSG